MISKNKYDYFLLKSARNSSRSTLPSPSLSRLFSNFSLFFTGKLLAKFRNSSLSKYPLLSESRASNKFYYQFLPRPDQRKVSGQAHLLLCYLECRQSFVNLQVFPAPTSDWRPWPGRDLGLFLHQSFYRFTTFCKLNKVFPITT